MTRCSLISAWTTTLAALAVWTGATAPVAAMERAVVISAYQGPCKDGDFAANLATTRAVIEEAKRRKSDFVVLPETFLSGYDTVEHMRQGARPVDDPALQALVQESAGHGMVVLVGLARKTPEGIYNSELVIHAGKLLGVYDKAMLTGGDRKTLGFLPGKAMPVFEAHGARFAVIICHDSSFPHPAMAARLKGAEILFSPHYNQIGRDRMDDHLRWTRNTHVSLACHMGMAVVRSNVVGVDPVRGLGYGGSVILSPQGEVLAEAKLFATELLTATITPEMLKRRWASFDEVPDWLKEELREGLKGH